MTRVNLRAAMVKHSYENEKSAFLLVRIANDVDTSSMQSWGEANLKLDVPQHVCNGTANPARRFVLHISLISVAYSPLTVQFGPPLAR